MHYAKKFLSAFCALVLTLTTVLYAWDGVGLKALAVEDEGSGIVTYDFRDGSIIPKDTDGNSDVTHGDLTVKVGTPNAYQYGDTTHGTIFKAGNTIEIAVDGPTKLSIGDCQYSSEGNITVKSTDGSLNDTKAIKTGCYHNGKTVDFVYTGKTATTLKVEFSNTQTYIPVIITEPIIPEVRTTYDFTDGSIVPTNTTNGSTTITSGKLTIKPGNQSGYVYNGQQHGVAFKIGNSIEIKVSGAVKVTVGDCQFNKAEKLTIKSEDGKYSAEKTFENGGTCYNPNNGTGTYEFNYKEKTPTTLTIDFYGETYVPIIITEPIEDEPEPDTTDDNATYNFMDGSIIPKDTGYNGNTTLIHGNLTIKPGSEHGFGYNADGHGAVFQDGNSIEIKVSGATKVTVGDCLYGVDSLTMRSADGKFSNTQTLKKGCYHNGGSAVVFTYNEEDATTLIIDFTNTTYVPIIITEPIEDEPDPVDPTIPPEPVGNGKADVWDFGAEQLDTSKYNNMLTVADINGLYPEGTAAGSSGVSIGGFTVGDLRFEANNKTNHRIRTTNTSITRYDGKTLTADGITLTGYLCSNSEKTSAVYLAVKLNKNDILTVYAGGVNADSKIVFVSPKGDEQSQSAAKAGQKLTFYAAEAGEYKLYSENDKLVIARLIREHTNPVKVSGTVDVTEAEGIPSGYKLCFTNTKTGTEDKVSVTDGAYTVYLNESYTYELSLIDANGYIIKDNTDLEIPKGSGDVTKDIAIENVSLVAVTGNLTGLSAAALAKLKLSFVNEGASYVPEITVTGSSYSANLEAGVIYTITVEGINDYELSGITTISAATGNTQDIAFALKPVYDVTVTLDGIPDDVKSSAALQFTNTREEGYVYTFAAGETPKLRDGTYSIKVTGVGNAAYVQKFASVEVNGAAVSKTIEFEPIEVWDFSKFNKEFGGSGIETIGSNKYYLGLELTGSVSENKIYLLANNGAKIAIPVKAGQSVTIEYCHSAAFEVGGKQVSTSTGSTSTLETVQVGADSDGFITVTCSGQTYFTKITTVMATEFKSKVTVGKDKDYQTINDALTAVSKMVRPNNERVEIVIDPGNYEEMLVINIPNISLVNAAGANASLSITNKGVDIGANVVRITSYYGHGYSYYSMGSDCKWNAETLAANKANSSVSKVNPGSGTTDGSYWNATVVVNGSGFEADGIVFENSFNQYISKKEAADTVVMWASGSKGARPTTYGDTSVQKRSFVERAAAIAILGDKSVFNNCKFIGRQDTLYGQTNIKAVFQKCDILGAVDFIFGGINAVFYQCQLRMNTSDDKGDLSYLTAAQQSTGRGYLMYNCTVTSTTPGVDTASAQRSKPGYFGRPWQPNTSEVIFYYTVVETASTGKSLIEPEGWSSSLNGNTTSPKMCEYGTMEKSGEDNSASRVTWAKVLTDSEAEAITIAAFLGNDWTTELNGRGYVIPLDFTPTELTDEETGITATVPYGAFDNIGNIELSAKLESSDDGKFTYNIGFTDKTTSAKVQPKVPATVKIPLPEDLKTAETVYVYHVETNGTYTDISSKIEAEKAVFSTDKSDKFIVSGSALSSPSTTPSTPSRPSSGGSSRPSHSGGSSGSSSTPSTSVPATPSSEVSSMIDSAASNSTVKFNGIIVDADITKTAADKGLNLEITVDDTFKWNIDAEKITEPENGLRLTVDTTTVDNAQTAKVERTPGNLDKAEMSFTTKADNLGDGATLTIKTSVKPDESGLKFANLYKTKPDGTLEFVAVAPIAADGTTTLPIGTSGTYTIIASTETKKPADLNNDCKVDLTDLVAMLKLYADSMGITRAENFKMDYDNDNQVKLNDLVAAVRDYADGKLR